MEIKPEFLVQREGRNFVLYAGLLDMAHQSGLKSIVTTLIQIPSPDNGNVAICQAIVETEKGTFSGIGDASPDNVTRIMRQHIIRMAETRAKARALRDAVNVGVAALEELGEEIATQSNQDQMPAGMRQVAQDMGYIPSSPQRSVAVPARTQQDRQQQESNRGTGNELASLNQVNAIKALAKNARWNEEQTQSWIAIKFGESMRPEDLTRKQASEMIDSFQTGQAQERMLRP